MEFHALVVDRDAAERRLVGETLRDDGWQVREACSIEEALLIIDSPPGKLVFCDAQLSTGSLDNTHRTNLLDLLKKRLGMSAQIVVTAASGAHISAVEAVLNGASDYIIKPITAAQIRERSRVALNRLRAVYTEAEYHTPILKGQSAQSSPSSNGLIGESDAMVRMLRDLARILLSTRAERNAGAPRFLITGETGTGKELLVRLIHSYSGRVEKPFVPVNCGALPVDLAESEFFGHEAGAYTGAGREKPGLWEAASGGTLFLDEICEAPTRLQPKLLRVLQDGAVRRVGSNRQIPVDVQIIAATNRNVQEEINAGRFRRDLYHRLSLYELSIPPLRDRREDIPLLVNYFATKYASDAVRVRFSRDAIDYLRAQTWRGNVRELENVVRAAVVGSPDGMVYAADLQEQLRGFEGAEATKSEDADNTGINAEAAPLLPEPDQGLEKIVNNFKMKIVREALAKHNGNVTRAANMLKISRPSFYKLLKEAGENK
jgi:DNA-binding NtrC family response regulator